MDEISAGLHRIISGKSDVMRVQNPGGHKFENHSASQATQYPELEIFSILRAVPEFGENLTPPYGHLSPDGCVMRVFSRLNSVMPDKNDCCGENHSFVCRTSRDGRDDHSRRLRRDPGHIRYAMREANSDSLRREQCHNIRHCYDSDGDTGGLFVLHAGRFYADWRIVR